MFRKMTDHDLMSLKKTVKHKLDRYNLFFKISLSFWGMCALTAVSVHVQFTKI